MQAITSADGAEQASYGGVGIELPGLFVFAAGGGGKGVDQMNDDQVAGVPGFVVGGESGKGAGGHPETAKRGGSGGIHGANALEIVIVGSRGDLGLAL